MRNRVAVAIVFSLLFLRSCEQQALIEAQRESFNNLDSQRQGLEERIIELEDQVSDLKDSVDTLESVAYEEE